MVSAALALIGALVYGAADFLGGLAAKRLRSIVVTATAAASGLVFLLVVLPFTGSAWVPADVGWGVTAGAFGVVAIVLLYACLAIGPMSILSPLTAVVSAIAPMVWGLAVNAETLSPVAFVGLGVALVAVILVGFIPGEAVVRPSGRGIAMAIGAGLAIGGFLIALDQTDAKSGLIPLVLTRTTSTAITVAIVAVMIARARRQGRGTASALVVPAVAGHSSSMRTAWMLAFACGLLDAVANCLLLLALRSGDLSIVSALTALYPAGTILLAAVVLRERVAAVQWAGLALALVAGGLLALG